MLKPWGKMDSNYLESPEFANGGEMALAPGSSTNNQSRPCCRSRPTAPRGVRLRAWRNGMAISPWPVTFGEAHLEIRVRGMRLTNNWRSTTNIRPATRRRRARLFAKRSMNFAGQTTPAHLPQAHITRSEHDSSIEWPDWNEKASGLCSK